MAFWACAPRGIDLAQNYALNKKDALNSEQRLTTSFYGMIAYYQDLLTFTIM